MSVLRRQSPVGRVILPGASSSDVSRRFRRRPPSLQWTAAGPRRFLCAGPACSWASRASFVAFARWENPFPTGGLISPRGLHGPRGRSAAVALPKPPWARSCVRIVRCRVGSGRRRAVVQRRHHLFKLVAQAVHHLSLGIERAHLSSEPLTSSYVDRSDHPLDARYLRRDT